MDTDKSLVELLNGARNKIATASENADANPRPNTVCSGHDLLYSMVRAMAAGVDVCLAVLASFVVSDAKDRIAESNKEQRIEKKPSEFWVFFYTFLTNNSKFIISWVAVIVIVAILRGELQTLLNAIPGTKNQTTMIQYEPAKR